MYRMLAVAGVLLIAGTFIEFGAAVWLAVIAVADLLAGQPREYFYYLLHTFPGRLMLAGLALISVSYLVLLLPVLPERWPFRRSRPDEWDSEP